MGAREYVFRLRGEAEQLIAAHERAAVAVDKHADQTAVLARQQAAAQATGDRFIGQLKEQLATFGKGADDLMRYRAAQAGVASDAAPLILQLQNRRAAQEAANEAMAAEAAAQRQAVQARDQAASRADAFVSQLREQVSLFGLSADEVMRYRAAQAGAADAADPLIAKLSALRSAQEAAAQSAAAEALAQREAAQAKQRAEASADAFIVGLRRQAEAVGKNRTELLAMQAAEMGVADRAAPFIARLQQGEKAAGGFARTGKMTAMELQQVGYQLNDLAVQVASGQNPLIALVQQGSQLSGTFGGIRPAMQAVFSLFTPARLAVGGLAAGVGLLAMAWAQGDEEASRFSKSLALTGNVAGQTRGSMDALARSTAENAQVTIGSAREIAQALVSTGKVGPKAIEPMAEAIGRVQKLSGESAESVVKDFATMSAGVARWAAEHNRQYNYLTVEQYRYIRALEAQGKTEEAMAENARLLNEALGKRTVQLGTLERTWNTVKMAASGAWDAMLGIGREATLEERLADVRARLAMPLQRGSARSPAQQEQAREALRQQEATLMALLEQQRAVATKEAEEAKKNSKAIEAEQQASQSAQLAIQKAGHSARRATQEVALEADRIALERSYDQGEKDLASYVQERQRIEARGLAIKEAAVDQEIALEKRRQSAAGTPAEVQQSQARIGELRAQRIALQADRLRLAEEARKDFGLKPKTDTLGDFITERALPAAAQRARDRDRALEELRLTSKQLAVSVLTDDRKRGEMQIALEEEQLRQKMKLQEWYGDDLRRAEDELAAWRLSRERELNDALKPEWQRRLEAWEDVERSRQRASDEFNLAFVEGGRQAFGSMLAEGKASFDDLKKFALRSLGEMLYERSGLGRSFAMLGDLAFNGLTRGLNAVFPGAGGGAAQSFATPASGFIGGAVPYAKGGTFGGGSDLAAYRDTIVSKPTFFRFAKGARLGQMGEETSEAIMPLVRSASGHLGVRAVSSQASAPPVVQPIVIENHGADIQQQQDPGGAMRLVVRTAVAEVDSRIAGGGSTARAMSGRFGLNNGAALSRRRG